jgi:hypothetical protein
MTDNTKMVRYILELIVDDGFDGKIVKRSVLARDANHAAEIAAEEHPFHELYDVIESPVKEWAASI